MTDQPIYKMTKFFFRALSQAIIAEGEGRVRSFTVNTSFVTSSSAANSVPTQHKKQGHREEKVLQDRIKGKLNTIDMLTPIETANLFIFGFSRFARYFVGGDLLFDDSTVLTYSSKSLNGN
jgi:3-hydroxybutyrate dehydrogenase